MSRRNKRGFVKTKEVMEKLEAGRNGAIQVRAEAKINSPEYKAAGEVTSAIDNLAERLTGDHSFFHSKGHG